MPVGIRVRPEVYDFGRFSPVLKKCLWSLVENTGDVDTTVKVSSRNHGQFIRIPPEFQEFLLPVGASKAVYYQLTVPLNASGLLEAVTEFMADTAVAIGLRNIGIIKGVVVSPIGASDTTQPNPIYTLIWFNNFDPDVAPTANVTFELIDPAGNVIQTITKSATIVSPLPDETNKYTKVDCEFDSTGLSAGLYRIRANISLNGLNYRCIYELEIKTDGTIDCFAGSGALAYLWVQRIVCRGIYGIKTSIPDPARTRLHIVNTKVGATYSATVKFTLKDRLGIIKDEVTVTKTLNAPATAGEAEYTKFEADLNHGLTAPPTLDEDWSIEINISIPDEGIDWSLKQTCTFHSDGTIEPKAHGGAGVWLIPTEWVEPCPSTNICDLVVLCKDKVTGNPILNVTVKLDTVYSDDSDTVGKAVFTGITCGTYQLTAQKSGYKPYTHPTPLDLTIAGETYNVTIELEPEVIAPPLPHTLIFIIIMVAVGFILATK